MVDLLDEDKLVDELLDYDSVDSNEPAASPPARSTAKHGPQAASSYVRSQPGRSSAGGSATVASGQAAEAAAAFSRLSCGSAGSTDSGGLNSKAASDAAAAFMVGKGAARPPSTIQPGKNPAPQAASAADLRLLHDRQWDWALAVHGSDDAALAASWVPKDAPDYALYSVYMEEVRACLESPDVEDAESTAGARLRRMVGAFRAYMACLYASSTFIMEHRYSNLETLSQLGELSAEMASLSGDSKQEGGSSTGETARSQPAALGGGSTRGSTSSARASGAAVSGSGESAAAAATAEEAGEAKKTPAPIRSRRSKSAPVVKRPSKLSTGDGEESPGSEDDRRRDCCSLDLNRPGEGVTRRPDAEKLKEAYRDRATMDVRPTIAAISFTSDQQQEVLQRRRKLNAELQRSQAERKTLLARLQIQTTQGQTAIDGSTMDASAALLGNLDAEGRVITDFSAWFTCYLLTPLQHARCNATCYPYMPDVIGISDVLAAEPVEQ